VVVPALLAGPVVFLDFMRAPLLKAYAEVRNDQVSHVWQERSKPLVMCMLQVLNARRKNTVGSHTHCKNWAVYCGNDCCGHSVAQLHVILPNTCRSTLHRYAPAARAVCVCSSSI
jgi:hypothetical protein